MRYEEVRNHKLRMTVQTEVNPGICPEGHEVWQRPSWTGCDNRGHRTWSCSTCHVKTDDPDCPCQRDDDCE